MPRRRCPARLAASDADALLEVAVGADAVGPVVDDGVAGAVELGGQAPLRDGHAHGVGEALAERPGGGLDARRQAVLRVARGARAELAEALQLVERQVVAGEVQQRVEQHAGVAGAESTKRSRSNQSGRVGAWLQEARPQHVGHGRGAHGRARVAAVGLLDAVDGEGADGVDGQLVVDGWWRCRSRSALLYDRLSGGGPNPAWSGPHEDPSGLG